MLDSRKLSRSRMLYLSDRFAISSKSFINKITSSTEEHTDVLDILVCDKHDAKSAHQYRLHTAPGETGTQSIL
jgi:hypothetical protein